MNPHPEYRKRARTRGVILHDSHTVPSQANMEYWLKVTGRTLGLLTIGYHYVIFQDGTHLCTRPHDTIGSHTRGFNDEWLGVCLAGGRREINGPDGEIILQPADNFTQAQRETLQWLFKHLSEVYGSLLLKGHSELGTHKNSRVPCPSLNMERLRQWLDTK